MPRKASSKQRTPADPAHTYNDAILKGYSNWPLWQSQMLERLEDADLLYPIQVPFRRTIVNRARQQLDSYHRLASKGSAPKSLLYLQDAGLYAGDDEELAEPVALLRNGDLRDVRIGARAFPASEKTEFYFQIVEQPYRPPKNAQQYLEDETDAFNMIIEALSNDVQENVSNEDVTSAYQLWRTLVDEYKHLSHHLNRQLVLSRDYSYL